MSRKKRTKIRKEIKAFWMASSLAIFMLLSGAILQINGYIHQNSLLNDSKKQVIAISAENDALESELSQSNSLSNFNEYAVAQSENYEKVDVTNVRYIKASSSHLVIR